MAAGNAKQNERANMFRTLSEIEIVAKWVFDNIPPGQRIKLADFAIEQAEKTAAKTETPIDDDIVRALASVVAANFDEDSIKRAVIGVLEELAIRTASPIDDEIVGIVAHALGVEVSK